MRYGLSLALILALVVPVGAAESGLADHLKRLRAAGADERAKVLGDLAKVLLKRTSLSAEEQKTSAAILGEVKSAVAEKDKTISGAGWALAGPVVALMKPLPVADAAWLLEHVRPLWEVRLNDEVATAAIGAATLTLFDGTKESARAGRAAERSLKKTLGVKGESDRLLAVAIGLARAPDDRARALLGRVLPRKGMSDEHVVKIIAALGEGGGVSAVPILLQSVPRTSGAVLEAALVALSKLDADALRKHGKKILGVTISDNEEHYREMQGLTRKARLNRKEQAYKALLEERVSAWTTGKIVDKPPVEVPAGGGVRGVAALWWKVIDALQGRISPPKPAAMQRPHMLNGRPNVRGLQWYVWWRSAR